MKVLVTMAILLAAPEHKVKDPGPPLIRSVANGRWSDPATWEGGKVPAGGRGCRSGPGTSSRTTRRPKRRSARSTSRGRSASTPIATPGSTSA